MKTTLLLLPLLLLSCLPAGAQNYDLCPALDISGADLCNDACVFCFLDGQEGSTQGFTGQDANGFCDSVENEQWYGFVANATAATISVASSTCLYGNGVQVALYPACGATPLPGGCNPGVPNGASVPASITVDLIPGNVYYLMVDGYDGDGCNFKISVDPPGAILSGNPVKHEILLCQNETYAINGIDYAAPDTITVITPVVDACDKIDVYYLLEKIYIPVAQQVIFCPGESVTVDGVVYQQPATVTKILPGTGGCDTLLTYNIGFNPDAGACPSCSETFFKTIGFEGQNVRGYGIFEAGDGNLYVTGTKQDSALLMKIYPSGGVIWSRTFDITPGANDNIAEVIEDSEGMIAGCGQSGDLQPDLTGFAFRYDPVSGNMLWVRTFSEESPYVTGILEKAPGGNYLVYSNPHQPVNDAGLTEISRLDGSFLPSFLSKRLNLGAADNFNSALISNGNFYGVGRFTMGNAFTDMRHSLTRIDLSNGDITYTTLNHVPPGNVARLYGMDLLLEDTNIISTSFGDENGENLNNSRIFLHKTLVTGNLQWTKRFDIEAINGESVDELVSVPDGYIMYCHNLSGAPGDLYLIKTDKSGNLVWAKKVDFGFNDNLARISGQSQIIEKNGYLYFVATTTDENGRSQMLLVKTTGDATLKGDCDFITDTPVTASEVFNPSTWAVAVVDMLPSLTFSSATAEPVATALRIDKACKVYVDKQVAVGLCPGESIVIGGIPYFQEGTVVDTVPGNAGCDSIITYTITALPQPERAETILFCKGDSITIDGNVYTQPGIVVAVAAAMTGCDTLITYTLEYIETPNAALSISCSTDIDLPTSPGTGPVAVQYPLPVATSDCNCPGIALALTQGLPPGALFPPGTTMVCYEARDSCDNTASCCFEVTVREELGCDIKETACMKYELLSIAHSGTSDLTYRIRATNKCANKLIYTAIQIPDGTVATAPGNNTVFTAQSGRMYDVRNPNYSPFYSVRFKSQADSISNGQSDIFEYTIPGQAPPAYIQITSRLYPQLFYEAYLNTFYCPVQAAAQQQGIAERDATDFHTSKELRVFPNPTDGLLYLDLSAWPPEGRHIRIFSSQGQLVQEVAAIHEGQFEVIRLPKTLPDGLYVLEVRTATGIRETVRFVKQDK